MRATTSRTRSSSSITSTTRVLGAGGGVGARARVHRGGGPQHLERRAAAVAGAQPQAAAVRAHDAEHRGEAEAVAVLLRREERLEYVAAGLVVHARAVVADLDQHVRAGGRER